MTTKQNTTDELIAELEQLLIRRKQRKEQWGPAQTADQLIAEMEQVWAAQVWEDTNEERT